MLFVHFIYFLIFTLSYLRTHRVYIHIHTQTIERLTYDHQWCGKKLGTGKVIVVFIIYFLIVQLIHIVSHLLKFLLAFTFKFFFWHSHLQNIVCLGENKNKKDLWLVYKKKHIRSCHWCLLTPQDYSKLACVTIMRKNFCCIDFKKLGFWYLSV